MNIDDVKTEAIVMPHSDLIWQVIFDLQTEAIHKYAPIERSNGHYYPFWNPHPTIDDHEFQHWIKEQAWRVTEELAEAMDVFPETLEGVHKVHLYDSVVPAVRHFFEEISDATHFFVETLIVLGLRENALVIAKKELPVNLPQVCNAFPGPSEFDHHIAAFVLSMGMAMNALKNKPWKVTQAQTDLSIFQTRIIDAWRTFLLMVRDLNITDEDMFVIFTKKHEVNEFRVRSQY